MADHRAADGVREFGNVTEFIAPDWKVVPFGFAGGLYDRDTALVRFGTRGAVLR